MNKTIFLKLAKQMAKKHGYDPKLLSLSENPKFKLSYFQDGKNKNFGSSICKDYIQYKYFAKRGFIDFNVAEKHRNSYMKRSSKINGEWKNNKYSKNRLSQTILWDGDYLKYL